MVDEEMTGEESAKEPEVPEEKPKKKWNVRLLVGAAAALFILATVANYIQMKLTYVPPVKPPIQEPQVAVEEGPVLAIDLSNEPEKAVATGLLAETVDEISEPVPRDSLVIPDSILMTIDELQTGIQTRDSLLTATKEELEKAKQALRIQEVQDDSSAHKRSVKLAKIVGNMPAEEAAKMLESLDDQMVVDILLQLKQRQAAKIMAAFPATRSARLSEAILKPLVSG